MNMNTTIDKVISKINGIETKTPNQKKFDDFYEGAIRCGAIDKSSKRNAIEFDFMCWLTEKSKTTIDGVEYVDLITKKEYSELLTKENWLIFLKFDDVKSFDDSLIINQNLKTIFPDIRPKTIQKKHIADKKAIDGFYNYRPGNEKYMSNYLDEIGEYFNIPTCKKETIGAICYIIYKKRVFKIRTFSEIVNILTRYWGVEPPKDKHPNKYKEKGLALQHANTILDRVL